MTSLFSRLSNRVHLYVTLNKQRFLWLLYVTGFACSVIGSFLLLKDDVTHPLRLFLAVVYSTIKLYLFAPIQGPDAPAPVLFQTAIWLAPLSTVIGFLTVFETIFVKIRVFLSHRATRQIVVVGLTADAEVFMNNVKKGASEDGPKRRVALIVDVTVGSDERYRLEKAGFRVFTLDFSAGDTEIARREVRSMHLDSAKALVTFLPEPAGYAALTLLETLLKDAVPADNHRRIPAHVCYQDEDVKELVRPQLDDLTWFDTHYFNVEEIMAIDLFQNKGFTLVKTPSLAEPWLKKPQTFEELDQALGRVNLLLFGFSELGQQALRVAINQGVISAGNKLKVTIVDRDADQLFDTFKGSVRHLDRIVDATVIAENLRSDDLLELLKRSNEQDPFTAAIFTTSDIQTSLLMLDRFTSRVTNVDTAVYSPRGSQIAPIVAAIRRRVRSVVFFGQKSSVLSEAIIMNASLNRRALAFNADYNRTAALIMGWDAPETTPEQQWEKLTSLKKDSSRAQSMHRATKRAILAKLEKEGLIQAPFDQTLQHWREAIDGKPIAEQIEYVTSDMVRNYLTALEHHRWNTFYYLHDFTWAQKTNEYRREHDSLIDDWTDFMKSPVADKAIYDFLSILAAQQTLPR